MILEADKYLKVFKANLRDIPEHEKDDIFHEIETHISIGLSNHEPIQNILEKLGKPEKLARSYSNEYFLSNNVGRPSLIWGILFYGFAGLTGIVVIPALSIIAVTLAVCGIVIPIVGLSNLLGITHVDYMVIGPEYIMPTLPAFIVGIVVGVILLLLSLLSWKQLVKYCRYISGMYHKVRVKR